MVARAGRLGCGLCVIFLVQGQGLGGRAGRPWSGDRRLGWSGQLADGGHVVEHEAGRAEPGVRRARRKQLWRNASSA